MSAGSQELFLYNHNPLLNYTPGVDGIKDWLHGGGWGDLRRVR